MTPRRFNSITGRYPELKVAVVGDYSLDRYLEIDPELAETSIETGLAVHNVTNVRSQPGSAGTIVNNLAALGVGTIYPIGFCGRDGEGYELTRALGSLPGVVTKYFLRTKDRRTFTYCKPLVMEPGQPPRELNRLDSKNWTHTPARVENRLIQALSRVANQVDAIVIMDQVDIPQTGVVTLKLLNAIHAVFSREKHPLIIADSRRGLRDFPPVVFKMNDSELSLLSDEEKSTNLETIGKQAINLARKNGERVIVTMAERGILGATSVGNVYHHAAFPIRGEIDIVGAGDSVTANLAVALAAGSELEEALILAMAAANTVIHQLGTTGTASVAQISRALNLTPA